MADIEDKGEDLELHEKEGSVFKGWPAMLLTIGMICAAIYSFSPRSYPGFPKTEVKADGFLANSLAEQGTRYVAVGERGQILYADSPEGPWADGTVDKKRGSTLTRIRFVDDNVAIAVGHDGWILRSTDAGKTWKEIQFDADSSDPLLDIGGPFDGKLFIVGSFGQFLTSDDLGKTWDEQSLEFVEEESEDEEVAEADAPASEDDDDYDPFAAFAEGGGAQNLANEHLNGIVQADDGALFIVGERGLIMRSTNNGDTWKRMDEIYDGSFYGGVVTPDKGLLVYGMRGNAFVTKDDGQTWKKSSIPVEQGLFEGTITKDGKVMLVGASNTVLTSSNNGASFKLITDRGAAGLVSVVPLTKSKLLTAGEGGVTITEPGKSRNSNNNANGSEGEKS